LFFELLAAPQKTGCAFANCEPLTFPHVCVLELLLLLLSKIQVLRSFSLHQVQIWLLARGRERFVSTKWDNWSDKTIVNNILPPPLALQSSRINSNDNNRVEMHLHAQTMCIFIQLIKDVS
jgi:hypothetical protein